MKISSSAFENKQPIPPAYTCDGDNVNPPLVFEDIPVHTKSLVLIVEDPDAPAGTFIHWVVYDIRPDVNKVEEGSLPEGGLEGLSSSDNFGYVSPCPPSGTHRYVFKLYALDVANLNPPSEKPDKTMVEKAMQGHLIDQVQLTGLYSRG